MKQVSYLFLVIFSLSLASCDKAIPDETMDGRGTFYCKVNGEDYFPDCQGFACQDVTAGYFTFGDAVSINSLKETNDRSLNIYIYL